MFEVSHSSITGRCEKALIVKVLSGGSERNILKIFEECEPKVMGIIAYPSKNSLAAALEAAEVLPKGGVCLARNSKEEEECIKAIKRLGKFVGSKVALVGNTAPWLVAQKANAHTFKTLFSIEVEKISISTLLQRFYEVEDKNMDLVIKNLIAGTQDPEEILKRFTRSQLAELARLHIALSDLINSLERRGFRAYALDCFEIIKHLGISPCITVAHILTANKPLACEGDLDSLLTQIVVHSAFNKVGGIFNLDYYEEDVSMFAHCTIPLYMSLEYTFVPHYETGHPAAIKARVDEGEEFSAIKFTGEGFEVLEGKTLERPEMDACRTQIWLKHSPNFVPWGNHRVLVNGKNWERIKFVADSLGLKSSRRFRETD